MELGRKKFNEFCKNENITRHCIVKVYPTTKRYCLIDDQTLLETIECMLSTVQLSEEFLMEVINLACYFLE